MHNFLSFDSCQTYGRQLSNIWLTRVKHSSDNCQTTTDFKHFKTTYKQFINKTISEYEADYINL